MYRAIRNFWIARQETKVGEIYTGAGVEELLRQGLVEEVNEDASAPKAKEAEVTEPPKAQAKEEKPSKGKKKKGA